MGMTSGSSQILTVDRVPSSPRREATGTDRASNTEPVHKILLVMAVLQPR